MDEYLFTSKGRRRARSPIRILSKKEKRWVAIDGPTHHGSVKFRREAYVKAGGYRPAFYYAQDWDLWYRLAALGTFAMVEQSLYWGRNHPELHQFFEPRSTPFGFRATPMLRRCTRLSDLVQANHTPSEDRIRAGQCISSAGACRAERTQCQTIADSKLDWADAA